MLAPLSRCREHERSGPVFGWSSHQNDAVPLLGCPMVIEPQDD